MDISSISSYTDYLKSVNNASADKVSNLTKSDYSSATDDELMDVCKEFEAYFIEQVYKEVAKTVGTTDYSSTATSTMMDYYKDNFIQELASMTSDSEDLGLAQMLYEQMKRNYDL